MRTHVFNKMTADEVESYLASGRNAIFIPVGVTEIHGEAPVDIEGKATRLSPSASARARELS